MRHGAPRRSGAESSGRRDRRRAEAFNDPRRGGGPASLVPSKSTGDDPRAGEAGGPTSRPTGSTLDGGPGRSSRPGGRGPRAGRPANMIGKTADRPGATGPGRSTRRPRPATPDRSTPGVRSRRRSFDWGMKEISFRASARRGSVVSSAFTGAPVGDAGPRRPSRPRDRKASH
jgi:hypothetical protein